MNYFVGIDIGGTNVEIGILNAQGDILGKESIKTESKKGAEDTFNRIWNKTKELAEKLKIKVEDIEAIGLGIPGPVVNNSVVKIAANFSWNNDFPAKDLMEKVTGKPVKVGNDVKVIALGETLFGAGKGYKNSITIPIGTGIAAGIIIDGKILEGAGGAAEAEQRPAPAYRRRLAVAPACVQFEADLGLRLPDAPGGSRAKQPHRH